MHKIKGSQIENNTIKYSQVKVQQKITLNMIKEENAKVQS